MKKNTKGEIDLHLILGQAGSGKSSKLFNMIETEMNEGKMRPIILCNKWLLVRSTEKKVSKLNVNHNVRVQTVQSITERTINVQNQLAGIDTIILDEFSQIDYNTLLSLADACKKVGITRIIAAGDFLQNEPIKGGSYSPMRLIIRQFLLGITSNFFASLNFYPIYEWLKDQSQYNHGVLEVPKDLRTMLKSISYEALLDNWRQNGKVTIRNSQDMRQLLADNLYLFQYDGEYKDKLKKAIMRKDWQIIVADWKQMAVVNKFAYDNGLNGCQTDYYIDIRGYQDENYRNYYKLTQKGYRLINGRDDSIKDDFELMQCIRPTFAIIADSAQGLEFDNVMLVSLLDESVNKGSKYKSWSNFSFNSLYMAMTRHKIEVDLCVDEHGWKDMNRTLDIVPYAKKDMIEEEWLHYCARVNMPAFEALEMYKNKSHYFVNNGYFVSNIGNTVVRFAKGTKTFDIGLKPDYTLLKLWKQYHPNIIDENVEKTLKKSKTNNSNTVILDWINEIGKENIDMSLSVRKFKAKYGKTKSQVEKYL